MVYYKSVSAIAGGGKTAVLLNTFSKGLARCSGSNWVFFPDPNWLCAPGANNRSKITNDGNIITDVFPSKNNTYSDVLLPLSSYSGSTTISVANIKNVIKKYSPSARVNGLNKEKLLQLLEDIRKTNNITNADLCNKFADEIYLPKIVLKKADIPLSLRSQFIDLR